jgi:uncharacterized protein YndB with AHSA1/START domain
VRRLHPVRRAYRTRYLGCRGVDRQLGHPPRRVGPRLPGPELAPAALVVARAVADERSRWTTWRDPNGADALATVGGGGIQCRQASDVRRHQVETDGVGLRRSCSASVVISASPDEVWKVVADVTRVGEWSGECRGCSWVDGWTGAAPRARFRGRNRRGGLRWTRLNEFVAVDRPRRLVWRTIARPPYPDSVEWQVTLTESPEGTRVSQSFEVVKIPKAMEWAIGLMMPAHRDRSADLAEDLERLKSVVETGARAPR